MCGSTYPTEFLRDVLRGRKLVSLERAVQMMTSVPAELFGLRDRGVVREGYRADLVLFDPAAVGAEESAFRADLPGSCERLTAGSTGVCRVWLNGRLSILDGTPTGELAGVVLQPGRDTATAPMTIP
jgi:N-acyl-D-aspartate/D-glutamate deacylase